MATAADALGLWVAFDGPGVSHVWSIYSARTGDRIGRYHHATRRYEFSGRAGTARGWRHALELAAGAAGEQA